MMPQLPDVRARRGIHGDLVRELATQIVGGTLAPGTQLDLEALASDAHV
jgi:DNA-binding GntR family transcriptional regulator